MIRALRYFIKKFYLLCAILLIALAVLVQFGRSFSYLVSDYRVELNGYLSQRLNAQVHIGRINAEWKGLKPLVHLHDIRITSHLNEPVLEVQDAHLRLDILRSLANFRIVWGGMNLHQVDLDFEQTAEGFWRIPGLHLQQQSKQAVRRDVLLDMLLLSRHIEFHQSHLNFRFADGHQINLDSPSLRLENEKDFHRLRLNVNVDEQKNNLSVIVEGRGDPRSPAQLRARGYVEFNDFPTSEPLTAAGALLLPGIDDLQWRSEGSLSARLWFSTRTQGEGFDLVGEVGLQTLSLPVLNRRLELASFRTDISGHWLHNGSWQLALQNISASVNDAQVEGFNLAASATGMGEPIRLQSPVIDVQHWVEVLDDAGAFGDGTLQGVMQALAPRGQLRDVQMTVPLDEPRDWQLQARAEQIGVSAWGGVPALTQVDGYLDVSQSGGYINLDSRNGFSMHFNPTYAEPMEFSQVRGQVAWSLRPDENQIYVNSGPLHFQSADDQNITEQVAGYLWLSIPWQRNSGDIDLYLQLGARDLTAGLYKKYTPALLPSSLLRWLEESIGDDNSGIVNEVGFVYRGTLNTRNPMARSHQLYLDVRNAELDFHSAWPGLTGVNGRLLVADDEVKAQVSDAKIYDSQARDLMIFSRPNPEGEGALLSINGKVQGRAADGLRLLRESALRQYIGENMDQWSLNGEMTAQIDLAVPLGANAGGARQKVNVELADASLVMKNLDIDLQQLSGHISYNDQRGIGSNRLKADLFGEPVRADLSSRNASEGVSQTLIELSGRFDHRTLSVWTKRPELLFLDGKIPYRAKIEILHRKTLSAEETRKTTLAGDTDTLSNSGSEHGDEAVATLVVDTDLEGVAVNLPMPYGKAPEQKRPLQVKLHLNQKTALIDVNYGDLPDTEFDAATGEALDEAPNEAPNKKIPDHAVHALLRFQRDSNELLNANIALANPAVLSPSAQFLVSGYLPGFNLEQWQNVLERYQSYSAQVAPGSDPQAPASPVATVDPDQAPDAAKTNPTHIAGLPFRVDVTLGEHQLGVLTLKQLAINLVPQKDAWSLNLHNSLIAGSIHIPTDKSRPIDINLQYLHLSNDAFGEEVETLEEAFDPRNLPLADVRVAELFYGGKNYGNWSVQLRPIAGGTQFTNIHGIIRGVTVAGVDSSVGKSAEKNGAADTQQQASGAQLIWQKEDTGEQTRFVGQLSAENMADVLQQWGITEFIESQSASYRVDLTWPGAPQRFSIAALKGNMALSLENGSFKRNSGTGGEGLLRLFGLVNFDTLARRLRLDFSDLYKSGLTYDRLQGKVNFDNGNLSFTEPLQVDSPSSRLQMGGNINLINETIDTRLIATLPVAGNLTFLAALATGLPAAAGVYVISKIFQKQVDQATSISYRIRGSWDEPEIKFDRLFESESSLREGMDNGDELKTSP